MEIHSIRTASGWVYKVGETPPDVDENAGVITKIARDTRVIESAYDPITSTEVETSAYYFIIYIGGEPLLEVHPAHVEVTAFGKKENEL